ncbi:tripartite motif-containing protein 5-like [Caloenas nicobarica]|uniref:tripartite motif-containing protein 5-like n=1 Tax=Caloenas nicobarica TaxID=187106 RepID=UPI0032B7AD34
MARLAALSGLEEELTCPICLDIYSTPVSLSCGHSFCKQCVQQSCQLRPQGPFSCPLCHSQADPAMELQPNVQLRSIVEKFLDAPTQEEKEDCEMQCEDEDKSSGQEDGVILCDSCLQEPQPAVKTCLTCEASLCRAHLSKHSTKSRLKDHVLVEPCDAQVLAERRCPQHGKLLECYCKTDSVCVCVMCCVASSHKNHEITPLEDVFGQAQKVLPETLKTVQEHEAALNQRITNLLKQEDKVEIEESLRRSRLESLFEQIQLQLENTKGEVLRDLRHNEEQQLSKIRTQIQNHEEEKDAASRDIQELKALRDQKDMLLFTKAFEAIRTRKRTPVPKTAGVTLPMPPMILDKVTTDTTLRLFQQFLSDMKSSFKESPVCEHLTVSINQANRFVSNTKRVDARPLNPRAFGFPNGQMTIAQVQSNQSFSEGHHFWEVDTSNATCWKLGIVQQSFECYLQTSVDSLRVFRGQTMIAEEKGCPTALRVVRVELDCRRNTLSFYNASVKDGDPAESLRLIETLSIHPDYPAYAIFQTSGGYLQLL